MHSIVRHPGRGLPRLLLFLLVGCGFGLGSVGAAGSRERPRIYAITGAKIVAAPGRTIDKGTIVLRDGLIESVGASVAVPPDAVEIDGSGRFVHAAFIDADSSLGFAAAPGSAGGGGGGEGGQGRAQRREEPTGAVHAISRIHPETRVSDKLLPFTGDRKKDVERIRNLGFAVVLATPSEGVLRGSSAAILLADDRPVAELILRDDVAQHAAFERGRFGQGYPTSLMGTVAALRQALLDAERHKTWAERYAANPVGMKRPDGQAAWGALVPVLERKSKLIFRTDDARDTLLAHSLGKEFDLDVAVSTASYEWELADALGQAGRVLIVSVAFPDKPEVKDDDEALEVTLDQLRRYVDAAAGPGKLATAGVRFALTMRGLKNTADFPKQVRKMIEAGLSPDTALAALTTVPAELLGISRSAGTLEAGKVANLVVADGPLFAEETKLRQVFVDGVPYEIEVKEKPKGDPNAVVDPRGDWSVALEIGGRTVERKWTIGGDKGAYSGTAETQSGTVTFDSVKLEGNVLTVVFPAQGDRPASEATVIIEGETFEGTAEFGTRTVELTGSRTSGPGGGGR